MIQSRREADPLGKLFMTIPAGRALVQIDMAGGGFQGDGEVAGLALDAGNPGHRFQFDVTLTPAFGEVRRQGAQVTVVGRKGAIELGHQAADGGGFVHQKDIPLGFGQVQGRSDAAEPGTDNQNP